MREEGKKREREQEVVLNKRAELTVMIKREYEIEKKKQQQKIKERE